MKPLISKLTFLFFFLPGIVLAHTGVTETTGFMHGFTHPIGGTDHILAMVAVGLWAAQSGGRALWMVPATFVSVMILGGILGFTGVSIPFIEEGILISVLVLGVLVAGAFKLPIIYSAAIVGFFAIFHGHAHGAEMPVTMGAISYTIGFALSTAVLHLGGIGIGMLMQNTNLQLINRLAGGTIVLGGFYLALA